MTVAESVAAYVTSLGNLSPRAHALASIALSTAALLEFASTPRDSASLAKELRDTLAQLTHVTATADEPADDIEALRRIRDTLTRRLTTAEGSEAATLARELRAVLEELRRAGAGVEGSALDEIAARRAKRRGAA